MQHKQILIEGKILSYYENLQWEKKWVLLFLHGWMQNGRSFEKIFKLLEQKNIPYLSLDLPWFWSSQLQHDDMSIDEYGNTVIALIEKLWLTKPHLIGHSFWWKTSIYIGSFYKNISTITLLCSAWIQRKMPLHWYFIIKTGKVLLSLPGLKSIGWLLREWLSSPDMKNAGKMTKIFRNAIADDYKDKMKLINKPTLMIWWDRDDQTPVSDAQLIHKHIDNSDLHILDWTHFVHQEKPSEITELILNFIKK